jgi:hypothetical protein
MNWFSIRLDDADLRLAEDLAAGRRMSLSAWCRSIVMLELRRVELERLKRELRDAA